jgi:lipopolysaccharide transport system permease protein
VHDEGRSFDEVWGQVLQDPKYPERSPDSIQGDQYWTARALGSIAAEPWVYVRYAVEKVAYYWVGNPYVDWDGTYPLNYALLRRWGFTLPWALSLLVTRTMIVPALIAALVLRRQWRRLFPVYAVLAYCTMLHAATHAEARFSDPFQPLLMVLVGGALAAIWMRLRPEVMDSQPSGSIADAGSLQEPGGWATTSGLTFLRGRRLSYLCDLVRELVSRELKLRYRRSILGILWSLLNPLAQLLVFVLIFERVLRLDIPNYPSFVFVGVLSWNWFQSALSIATGAITDNRELVKRPGFPMAILPVVTVTTHLIHFLLALPILLLFVLLSGGRLTSTVLFLPLVMALQFLLILGLSYLTAAVHVTFRDTQHLLGVFLMLLFYLTPVFYDSKIIPERYQALYNLNPMARLVTAYRTILVQGQTPDLVGLLVLGILLGLLVWLGYAVFRQASYRFVEEL